ncbi:ComF family protein [Psychrobacter phenylpyruvicus]|uniref:DNA utilization protein GntX n=1 Tax=Psychrobacter phenylpyruvicus TaxID=29432 RepID=A0A379LJI1_9GAMM|nr:ComF family protein [Psychrobacter phenylpyruvicus]SUD89934.1 DNA utilization protein GntX [Psychrobacter phenylpyruvicus]
MTSLAQKAAQRKTIRPRVIQQAVPAFYQLGMWRVQYLQSVCCVCHSNPAVAQKEGLHCKRSFFSSIICQACHDSVSWQPKLLQHLIPLEDVDPLNSQPVSPRTLQIQAAAPHLSYIRAAIIAFKYKEQVDALPVLVHAIHQLPRPKGCHATNSVIVPTPTTSNRLKKRGYDPVSVLAYYLSKHWQIPLWYGVNRIDDAVSQQGLARNERQANISHAFNINAKPTVKRLLLFDDVVTTGTTLAAIAKTITNIHPDTKIRAYCVSHGK